MKINSKQQKILVFVALTIIVATVALLVYIVSIMQSLNHKELDKSDIGINSSSLRHDNNNEDQSIVNVALFGIDQREPNAKAHSDAVIIATIDKKHNRIKLSSLMRDSLVKIGGYDDNKLGQAYYNGGAQLAVKTLNENFGLDISEYVTVNFYQMAQIIDAVDGIEVDLSEAERVDANKNIQEQSIIADLPANYIRADGYQTLDGTQAVAYARIRHVGNGDFERTDRQRQVILAIFGKALELNPLQYPEFARKFLPTVETSLNFDEIINLSKIMLDKPTIGEMRFPANEDLIGDGIIWINDTTQCINVDLKLMSDRLRKFIYDNLK